MENFKTTDVSADKTLLLGCGILRKEIRYLIEKNEWQLETMFLDSALHCYLEKLQTSLCRSLEKQKNRRKFVFYGTCHPLMNNIIEDARTCRTPGQNCVEILLGKELFSKHLARGAFFLLEEWAQRFEEIMIRTFSTTKKEVIREIFKSDRKCILAIRTPCSNDFSKEAEAAARFVDLPLEWLDVSLTQLENVLKKTMQVTQEKR